MDRFSKRPPKKSASVFPSGTNKGTSPEANPGSGSVVGRNMQANPDPAENKRANKGRGYGKASFGDYRDKATTANDNSRFNKSLSEEYTSKSRDVDLRAKHAENASRSKDNHDLVTNGKHDEPKVGDGNARHRAGSKGGSNHVVEPTGANLPKGAEKDTLHREREPNSRPVVMPPMDGAHSSESRRFHARQEGSMDTPGKPPQDDTSEYNTSFEGRGSRPGPPSQRSGKNNKGVAQRVPRSNQAQDERANQADRNMHPPRRYDGSPGTPSPELRGNLDQRVYEQERINRAELKIDRHPGMHPPAEGRFVTPTFPKQRHSPRFSPDMDVTPPPFSIPSSADGGSGRFELPVRGREGEFNRVPMSVRSQMSNGVSMPCYPGNISVPGMTMHGVLQGIPPMPVGQYMGNRWVQGPSPQGPPFVGPPNPSMVPPVPAPMFVSPPVGAPRVAPVQARKSSAFQIRDPKTGEVLNTEAKAPTIAKPKSSAAAPPPRDSSMAPMGDHPVIPPPPPLSGSRPSVAPIDDPSQVTPVPVPVIVPPMGVAHPVQQGLPLGQVGPAITMPQPGQPRPGMFPQPFPQGGAPGFTPMMYTHTPPTPLTQAQVEEDDKLENARDQRLATVSITPPHMTSVTPRNVPINAFAPTGESEPRSGRFRVQNKAVEGNDHTVALSVRHPMCDNVSRSALRGRITNRRVDNTDYGLQVKASPPSPEGSGDPSHTPSGRVISSEVTDMVDPPVDATKGDVVYNDTGVHDVQRDVDTSKGAKDKVGIKQKAACAVELDSDVKVKTGIRDKLGRTSVDAHATVVEESAVKVDAICEPPTSQDSSEIVDTSSTMSIKVSDSPKVLPDPFILDPIELQNGPKIARTPDSTLSSTPNTLIPIYTVEAILGHGFASGAHLKNNSLGFKLVPIHGHSDGGGRESRESRNRSYGHSSYSNQHQASMTSSSAHNQRNKLFERAKVDSKWRREAKPEQPRVSPFKRGDITREEQFKRTVRSLLNKLTVEKFLTVAENMAVLYEGLTIEDDVVAMVDLVLEKSVSELDYSDVYADLAFLLKYRFNNHFDVGFKSTLFYRVLLNKCQDSFEALSNVAMTASLLSPTTDGVADDIGDGDKDDGIDVEDGDDVDVSGSIKVPRSRTKKWVLGNIRFMGELFLRKILSVGILKRIASTLLHMDSGGSRVPCEYLVESFLELITTIGYTLEQSPHGPDMLNDYMGHLASLKKHGNYSLRIVYKIQDLIDLRSKRWVKKVFKERATSVADIHLEAKQEELKGGSIHINQEGKYTTAGRQARRHYTDYLTQQRQLAFEKTVNGVYVAPTSQENATSAPAATTGDSTTTPVANVPPPSTPSKAKSAESQESASSLPKSALKSDSNKTPRRKQGEVRFAMDVVGGSVVNDIMEVFLQNPSPHRFKIELEQFTISNQDGLEVVRRMLHKCVNAKSVLQAEIHCDLVACTLGYILTDPQCMLDAFGIFEKTCLVRLQDEVLDNPGAVSLFSRILFRVLDAFAQNPEITLEEIKLPPEFELARDLATNVLQSMKDHTDNVGYAQNLLKHSFASFKDRDLSFLDVV
ncbi:MIF4G domain-containing protein [Babesia ovis]|uniref:MIF4G domain-containing protein n=1 Tax=Babesia ovis TaxID=5869 RepID=A0A9W5WW45_BABOV|nr:MIF4G domain-containing protein [Babesia ovis]